jgi:nucleoid DNA-binding protein
MNKSELIDAIAEKGEYLNRMLVRHSMQQLRQSLKHLKAVIRLL